MAYQKEYVLNVDIKKSMTNVIPTFVQYDNAALIFKIYDNGRSLDFSNFQRAEVIHKKENGSASYGVGQLITMVENGQRAIRYEYLGSEMNVVGNVLTSLSIYYTDGKKISILPFNVKIVKDIREDAGEQVQKEYSILEQLVEGADAIVEKARNASQRIDVAMQDIYANLSSLEQITSVENQRQANENVRISNENARSQDMSNRIHRGTYSPTVQYVKHNEVFYNGSTYRCLVNSSTGILPTNTTNWTIVSSKGADGTGGGTGTVSSVNGVAPSNNGNVNLTPSSIGAANETHSHQMSQITGLTSALSVKLEESDLNALNQQVSNLATLTNGLGTAANRNVGTSAGNIPIINVDGKLDASVMPAIAIKDTFVINSQTAMLSLTAQTGDIAIRTDLNKTFILLNNSPSTLASWQELLTSANSPVLSVAGKTGTIVLSASDVGLGNVTNESKTSMFTSPSFTGTPTAPTAPIETNTTQIATTAFVKSTINSHTSNIATTSQLGHVRPDGTTITINANGVISAVGGGNENTAPPPLIIGDTPPPSQSTGGIWYEILD